MTVTRVIYDFKGLKNDAGSERNLDSLNCGSYSLEWTKLFKVVAEISVRVRHATDKTLIKESLNYHYNELTNITEILTLINEEEALRTFFITLSVIVLNSLGENLKELLLAMEDRGFKSRVIHGKGDKERLKETMAQISNAKQDLCMRMTTAHVGLTQIAGSVAVANLEKIESVEVSLRQLIKDFGSLDIRTFVKERTPGTHSLAQSS
jgi:hypothetical protein